MFFSVDIMPLYTLIFKWRDGCLCYKKKYGMKPEIWYGAFLPTVLRYFLGMKISYFSFMSWGRHCYFMSYFHQALEVNKRQFSFEFTRAPLLLAFVTLVLEEADMANNLSAISLYMKFDQCRLVSLGQYLYQTRDSFNFLWSA